MSADPLEHPHRESEVLETFRRRYDLGADLPPERLLIETARAFSSIPYENLTKIIKHAACGSPEASRRLPAEVMRDHARLGTGGTCFSLTACLLHILRALGWAAEPILADRRYGEDTHCALLVAIDGEPHLMDPGYLILEPLPLDSLRRGMRLETAFNKVALEPHDGGERIDLFTEQGGGRSYRLTFKTQPADPARFLAAWDASFGWDMMRYPLLTSCRGGRQLYLQERRFQVRGREGASREEVPLDRLAELVQARFGVPSAIAEEALRILRSRGELHEP